MVGGLVDLNAVMDDLAVRLETITGLRVTGYPPANVSAPAGFVDYPERVEYDQTYGRGMTMISGLAVSVVVGKATDRTARERVASYVGDQGAHSVKLAIEAQPYTAWDDIQVQSVEFVIMTIAGVDYIAATFTANVACQGTPS